MNDTPMTHGCINDGVNERHRGRIARVESFGLDHDNAGGMKLHELFDHARAGVHTAREIQMVSELSQPGTNYPEASVDKHRADMP